MFKDFSNFNTKLAEVIRDVSVMDKLEAFEKVRGLISNAMQQISHYTKSYNSLSQGIINEGVYTDITPAAQSEAIYSPVRYAKQSMLRELDRAEERLSSLPLRVDVPVDAVIGEHSSDNMHVSSIIETIEYDTTALYMKVRFSGAVSVYSGNNYLYYTFSNANGLVSRLRADTFPAFLGWFDDPDVGVGMEVYGVFGRFQSNFPQTPATWSTTPSLCFLIRGMWPGNTNSNRYVLLNMFNVSTPADFYEIGGNWNAINLKEASPHINLYTPNLDTPFESNPSGSHGGLDYSIPRSISAVSSITEALGLAKLRSAFNEL